LEEWVNNRIGEAYRAKYRSSPYLDSMMSARARSAAVNVTPRDSISIKAGSP
jgi:hypothetical protein